VLVSNSNDNTVSVLSVFAGHARRGELPWRDSVGARGK
jgi:hypothetical protein